VAPVPKDVLDAPANGPDLNPLPTTHHSPLPIPLSSPHPTQLREKPCFGAFGIT
jgi:hypothetical protein